MADQQPSTSDGSTGSPDSPESSVELNIKTLNSQIYSVHADKNMRVSEFKQKIASQIGLPVEQQRLIFRGKVLKDDQLLSEYHVENGHTLHLVERQPSPLQSSSSSNVGSASSNTNGRAGMEPGINGVRNRVGQISHSVVLGTFNVGEQGEGTVPDLSRVIGAVFNSFGIGNHPGTQPGGQVLQRSATEGTTNGAGFQSQGVNQSQTGQPFTGQSLPQAVQIPLGAAIALPSLSMPIPDSLSTINEFVSRMEQAMSQHGYQPSQSPPVTDDPPATELPLFSHGVPTPEALSIILRRVQHLIGGQAIAALSHVAGRLEQEAGSNDPAVRGQVQTESVQVGLAMQHLGALLLELGRTMLTLRMGQTPAESSVNAGPSVYVSPSGPNPIMVQPFPLQSTSMFGSAASVPPNPGTFGPVGLGNIPRNVNVHIHTGPSLAPFVSGVGSRTSNSEGAQGERISGSGSGDSSQSHAQSVRNFNPTPVPMRPAAVAVPGTVEPSVGVSLSEPVLFPTSGVLSEVNSQARNIDGNIRSGIQASPGQSEVSGVNEQAVGSGTGQIFSGVSDGNKSQLQTSVDESCNAKAADIDVNSKLETSWGSVGVSLGSSSAPEVANEEGASSSSQQMESLGGSSALPLGLGLGGLQPKRRARQSNLQGKRDDSHFTSNQSEQPRIAIAGQQVLQSIASRAARDNASTRTSGHLPQPSTREENVGTQFDVGDSMSQVLQSPALNGLLAGVSQQTGIGSPNALRNIMEQISQNPAMRNTVNPIAQQMDNHDVGNMLASLGGGQGGGFDLSRMVQQMMPIVSQALGGMPAGPRPTFAMGPDPLEDRLRRDVSANVRNTQHISVEGVAHRIEQGSPGGEIFRCVVESAVHLCDGGNDRANIVNELCSWDGLVDEFIEMLRQDLSLRIQDSGGH